MRSYQAWRWWVTFGALAVLLGALSALQIACGQEPKTPETDAAATPPAAPSESDDASIPTKNVLAMLRDGGPLMIPIGLCSFLLCMFVFERSISLRGGRVIPRPFLKRFLSELEQGRLDQAEAIKRCEENRSPLAQVFAAACAKWGRPSVEVEQAVIDSGERVTHGLRRYLRLFNGISTVCPLLGLLGTVTGMIQAFNSIASADAMGRPELLASGISQALLTTAAGLTVAIPALIAYLFFVSRVDRLVMDIDQYAQQVVARVAAEARSDTRRKRAA